MSFIHDALKKAQQRKDSSYSNYEKLISDPKQPVREKSAGRCQMGNYSVLAVLVLQVQAIIIYQESSGINFSAKKSSVTAKAAGRSAGPCRAAAGSPLSMRRRFTRRH